MLSCILCSGGPSAFSDTIGPTAGIWNTAQEPSQGENLRKAAAEMGHGPTVILSESGLRYLSKQVAECPTCPYPQVPWERPATAQKFAANTAAFGWDGGLLHKGRWPLQRTKKNMWATSPSLPSSLLNSSVGQIRTPEYVKP